MTRAPGETLVYDQFVALKYYKQRWDGNPGLLFSSLKAFEMKLADGVTQEKADELQAWIDSIQAIIAALKLEDPEADPTAPVETR